ncbi:uncharacterized protein LOC133188802 [Saccostrea echinata]|uniref:uncharacterized protein LOC133188802 n=1 Tax=Saccostrea echinata TaxID=191078 RepID=UPI002A7EBCC2|nr:uncharacterized protein LOC133188802 [Saccostrea echinata]
MFTIFNNSVCGSLINDHASSINGVSTGIQGSLKITEAFWLILGFGFFASLLAVGFSAIRKYIYKDKNSLDVSFDAGGNVNAGLTATTLVSQWTWAATLLQSATVGSKYGISGPFWYAAGASIQMLLFSMVSVQLKIRAPGAKTFLQVIKARFGSRTHKIYCAFALMTNVIVTAMLMLGGAAVMKSLVHDISVEYATLLVTAVIGAYTFIGGLGGTFYVSYFNTGIIYILIMVFVMNVFNDEKSTGSLGKVEKVYALVSCSKGPDDNYQNSFLTIQSKQGLMFGIINIVGNFGTIFVDQSYWQSSVAAKPKQGVIGILAGGLCWFAIPFGLATTTSLAYIALSASQNQALLNDADVDAGLVPVIVAQKILGRSGELMIIIMILMAVTSTGSAEIMAVSSILIYDVYQLYLKPYRLVTDANSCILCGRSRGRLANPRDKCKCESMMYCSACSDDDKERQLCKKAIKPRYKCATHGSFREYCDYLGQLKNWCLLWSTLAILPLTITLNLLGLSLGWVYLFMGILIGSAVVPIALCMCWERLTGSGMVAGAVSGTVLALITWLSVAASNKGGLSPEKFFENTGKENAMLAGNLMGILSSSIITPVVSILTSTNGVRNASEIWENTRDIDNPLSPWTERYAKDLKLSAAHQLDNRPSYEDVFSSLRSARLLANGCSPILTILLVFIWPSLMLLEGVLDLAAFRRWIYLAMTWSLCATIFIIIAPLVYEGIDLRNAVKQMKNVHPSNVRSLGAAKDNCNGVNIKKTNQVHISPVKQSFSDPRLIKQSSSCNSILATQEI